MRLDCPDLFLVGRAHTSTRLCQELIDKHLHDMKMRAEGKSADGDEDKQSKAEEGPGERLDSGKDDGDQAHANAVREALRRRPSMQALLRKIRKKGQLQAKMREPYFWDCNTVEQNLLASGIMICVGGLMFQGIPIELEEE